MVYVGQKIKIFLIIQAFDCFLEFEYIQQKLYIKDQFTWGPKSHSC